MSGPIDFDGIGARYAIARMAGTAAVDAGEGWDDAKVNAVVRSWQDIYDLRAACEDLIKALRLTQEYVGPDTLPPIEGWSWYDALVKYAPEIAHQTLTVPTAKHRQEG